MAELDTHGPTILGVTWMLFALSTGFLGARIYAKRSRGQGLWWDDWVLIFSWFMFAIETGLTQYGNELGYGRHYYDIPVQNLTRLALNTSIAASVSCFASTASKISFGVTLLRLTFGWWRRFVWFAIVTLFLVMLPSAFLTWVRCTPTARAWDTTIEGYCWDSSITVNYAYFNAAWCTSMDFALALIPIHLIAGLQMKTKEKIGVSIAMSMGLLAGVCAIVKGIYLGQVLSGDFYYSGIDITIWTGTETATAIIGASLPVLRVLLRERLSTRGYNISEQGHGVPLSTVGGSRKPFNGSRYDDVEAARTKAKTSGWVTSVTAKEDNESDRSILRADDVPTNTGIIRTNEFAIDFQQADYGLSHGRRSPM